MYYVINPTGVDVNPLTRYVVHVYGFQGGPLYAVREFASHAEALAWRPSLEQVR